MTECIFKNICKKSYQCVLYINIYPMNAPDPFKSASYERTKLLAI